MAARPSTPNRISLPPAIDRVEPRSLDDAFLAVVRRAALFRVLIFRVGGWLFDEGEVLER